MNDHNDETLIPPRMTVLCVLLKISMLSGIAQMIVTPGWLTLLVFFCSLWVWMLERLVQAIEDNP